MGDKVLPGTKEQHTDAVIFVLLRKTEKGRDEACRQSKNGNLWTDVNLSPNAAPASPPIAPASAAPPNHSSHSNFIFPGQGLSGAQAGQIPLILYLGVHFWLPLSKQTTSLTNKTLTQWWP